MGDKSKTYQPTQADFDSPCETCSKVYDGKQGMVRCCYCCVWQHLECAGLSTFPPRSGTRFFCMRCRTDASRKKIDLETVATHRQLIKEVLQIEAVKTVVAEKSNTPTVTNRVVNPTSSDNQETSKAHETIRTLEHVILKQQNDLDGLQRKLSQECQSRDQIIADQRKMIASLQNSVEVLSANLKSLEATVKKQEEVDKNRSSENVQHEQDEVKLNDTVRKIVAEVLKQEQQSKMDMSFSSTSSVIDVTESFAVKQTLMELPKFSGDPRDWPMFISAYRGSNQQAKFHDYENVARLRKCLSGDALIAVQGFLLNPNLVEQAISELEKLYGRLGLVRKALEKEILDCEIPRENNPNSIVRFALKVKNYASHLQSLGNDVDGFTVGDTIGRIVKRLSFNLQARWYEDATALGGSPNITQFDNWLSGVAKTYREVSINNGGLVLSGDRDSNRRAKAFVNVHEVTEEPETAKTTCAYCESVEHKIAQCGSFSKLQLSERFEAAKGKRICFTCLGRNHSSHKCIKNRNKSKPKWHPLLRKSKEKSEKKEEEKKNDDRDGERNENLNTHMQVHKKNVIFRVVPVTIYGLKKSLETYAIFDDCSSISLVDSQIVKKLDLPVVEKNVPINLHWTQNRTCKLSCDRVTLHLSGLMSGAKRYRLKNIFTVDNLNLPQQSLDVDSLKLRYPHLNQANINCLDQVQPMLLLGLEHTILGAPLKVLEGRYDEPLACKTRIGWTIQGPDYVLAVDSDHTTLCLCGETDEQDARLEELVKYQFTTESFGVKPPGPPLESLEDTRAKELMETKMKFVNGRYVVPLLWKDDQIKLPDSKPMALKRLKNLEDRLNRDELMKTTYIEKINSYIEKGYARKLSDEELKVKHDREWYLPHFPVPKKKPGDLRLVFDAAAKVGKFSLNSFLLKGPDLYMSIVTVLLDFRLFDVAVVGDICEHFHQVVVDEEDQPALRFLWRDCDVNKEPQVYQMVRLVFGSVSSPFQVEYVKEKNAEKHAIEYPRASNSVRKKHFVDDYLESFPSEKEALETASNVKHVHGKGGFVIRNFISNSKAVQDKLNGESSDNGHIDLNLEKSDLTEKVLGVYWKVNTDELIFMVNYFEKFNMKPDSTPTKRQFLRILMSIYDPHGLIGNFVILGKMILQDVWRSKVQWDQKILPGEMNKFKKWILELEKIKQFRIPRCISPLIPRADSIQLHVFSDASDAAFSAVVKLRVQKDGEVHVRIIGSKTRVAPNKSLSVPRLELQGFILGLRWTETLLEALKRIKIDQIIHWTDSKTVISWMKSENRKYSMFVEHRISEALDYFEKHLNASYRYVPSKLNVADLATKWPKEFRVDPESEWINGPQFLYQNENEWPDNPHIPECEEEIKCLFSHFSSSKLNPVVEFDRFSSLNRMQRVFAWIVRYMDNLRRKTKKKNLELSKYITLVELRRAEIILIRAAQKDCFMDEIAECEIMKCTSKNSPIFKLSPFLDKNGLLRMEGRIEKANFVGYDTKFPIILKKDHTFTKLLIREYHQAFAHQHTETCIHEIRKKYWITHIRVGVKSVISECNLCKIRRANPKQPTMGDLPTSRMGPYLPPFTYCGMDLFGPVEVTVNRHHEKRWVVIYTCLVTRGVHFEIVSSLSTDACIMAFKNFSNFRVRPRTMHSDNGTNFVGMNRELKTAWQEWKDKKGEIEGALYDPSKPYQTEFRFNVPLSPWMGGSWERLVKTTKNVLKVMLNEKFPKEETLRSFLIEAMNIINSRPLTYLPTEDVTEPALTPNSFIKLAQENNVPCENFDDSDLFGRKQWRLVQQMSNHFWRRWVTEYLPELTRKTKWHAKNKSVAVGDIVLIVDPDADRNTWEKGRVINVYPDSKGVVRSADVKTATTIRKRPAARLAILDVVEK